MISNLGVAKLVAKNKPEPKKGCMHAGQSGRDFILEIDGKMVPGVMDKTINLKPNEAATLTIVMRLPVIEYIDADNG